MATVLDLVMHESARTISSWPVSLSLVNGRGAPEANPSKSMAVRSAWLLASMDGRAAPTEGLLGTAHLAFLVPSCQPRRREEVNDTQSVSGEVCGRQWLIEVPAVGGWTTIDDKKAITETASTMIAAVTEASGGAFRIDLAEGRVVTSIDEFAERRVFSAGRRRLESPPRASESSTNRRSSGAWWSHQAPRFVLPPYKQE